MISVQSKPPLEDAHPELDLDKQNRHKGHLLGTSTSHCGASIVQLKPVKGYGKAPCRTEAALTSSLSACCRKCGPQYFHIEIFRAYCPLPTWNLSTCCPVAAEKQ